MKNVARSTVAVVTFSAAAFCLLATQGAKEATASGLNCEQLNGPPALCYEWTVVSVPIGPGIFRQLCEQVVAPVNTFCVDTAICINNGLCNGNGACLPNPGNQNAETTCTLTLLGEEDGYYFCSCANNECALFGPAGVTYPASSTWCTVGHQ